MEYAFCQAKAVPLALGMLFATIADMGWRKPGLPASLLAGEGHQKMCQSVPLQYQEICQLVSDLCVKLGLVGEGSEVVTTCSDCECSAGFLGQMRSNSVRGSQKAMWCGRRKHQGTLRKFSKSHCLHLQMKEIISRPKNCCKD